MLDATTRPASYSALLPPAWPIWNLKPDNISQFSSDDVTACDCDLLGYPIAVWADGVPANQLHAVTSMSSQQPLSQVWTFPTINTSHFSNPTDSVTVPNQSLTDNLTSANTLQAHDVGAIAPVSTSGTRRLLGKCSITACQRSLRSSPEQSASLASR